MKIIFCIISLLISVNVLGQTKKDSLIEDKILRLENQVKAERENTERLNKMSDYNISNSNNVLTYANYALTFFSILLALLGVVVGIISYKNFKEVQQTEEKVNAIKQSVEEKENKIATLLNSLQEKETKFEKDFITLNNQKDKLETDISNLKSRFENESKKTLQLITLYNEAYDKLNSGGIKIAIKKFSSILEIDATHIEARCKLAMCYSAIDKNPKALTELSKYVNNEDSPATVFSTYGVILRRLGDYDEAIKCFLKAINLNFKNNHTTYSHLGYTYLYAKNLNKAIEYFNQSFEFDQNNSPSTYGILKAKCLLNPNESHNLLYDAAIKNAKRDIIENPKYPYPYFGLAFTLMLKNNTDCIKELLKAIELCKNIGILKEQLFEYTLFSHINGLNERQNCIDIIQREIQYLNELY